MVPMRTTPVSSPLISPAFPSMAWYCKTVPRIKGYRSSPSGVRRIPTRERYKSWMDSSSSREAIIWLTADWVYPSACAALVKLPSSTIFWNVIYRFMGHISLSNICINRIRFTNLVVQYILKTWKTQGRVLGLCRKPRAAKTRDKRTSPRHGPAAPALGKEIQ